MKITLVAAIGLGVGLLGGSAVGAVRTKKVLVAVQDSVAAAEAAHAGPARDADATHSVDLPPDGADPAGAHADTAEAPAEQAADSGTAHDTTGGARATQVADAAPAQTSEPQPQASAPAGHDAAADSLSALDPDGAKKLAKIFSAMKAPAAAAVLVEMSDDEVTAILLRMSDRQAGPIVGEFPPDRAASLGRVVLKSREGGE